MKKEDILEISRNENANWDEREKGVLLKAGSIAKAVGVLLCLILNCVELWVKGQANLCIWIVCAGMNFTASLIQYIHLKRRFDLVSSVLWLLFAVAFTVVYVLKLVL